MQNSHLIISLDFELMWGVRDKRTITSYGENIRGVRNVIPAMLQLFDQYGISATFATVGFLFAQDRAMLREFIPATLPQYKNPVYSPYENGYMDSIGNNEEEDSYHYAASLIRQIRQYPSQEIATHTFSHYYCLEQASLESFEQDLVAAINIAATQGIKTHSIVFPRNQFTDRHIEICKKHGLTSFRGNPASKLYRPVSNEELDKWTRARKLADSYINIAGHHCFEPKIENGIVNIPASSFLRPVSKRLRFLEGRRLARICNGISFAAKNNLAYHLWWHPHNFGVNMDENLHFLEQVLQHYRRMHEQWGMQSKTMQQIASETLLHNAV